MPVMLLWYSIGWIGGVRYNFPASYSTYGSIRIYGSIVSLYYKMVLCQLRSLLGIIETCSAALGGMHGTK